jgi:hypothetical protein
MILIEELMNIPHILRLYPLVLLMMIKNVKENFSGNLKMNLNLEIILIMRIFKEMNEI